MRYITVEEMVCCVSGLINVHTLYVNGITNHNLSFSHAYGLISVLSSNLHFCSASVRHFCAALCKTSAYTHYRLKMKINYTTPKSALLLSRKIQVYCETGFSQLLKEVKPFLNTQSEPCAPVLSTVRLDNSIS